MLDKSLINEFLAESKEHLETIEENLLSIEKQEEKLDKKLINRIFRCIHTIKGSANFLGFSNINNLTHVMETLLSALRTGQILPDSEMIDTLLEGVDTIQSLLNNLENSNTMNISKIQKRLGDLLGKKLDAEKPQKKEEDKEIQVITISSKKIPFKVDKSLINQIPGNHQFLFLLKYDFISLYHSSGISPAKIIKILKTTGQIVKGLIVPPKKDLHGRLPEKDFFYHVLFSTALGPDLISEAVHLTPQNILQVKFERVKKVKEIENHVLEDLITPEMVDKFISESNEILDRVEKDILEIEKNPNNKELISEAFRAIHSLKGNAGFFEYTELEEKSMEMETMLASIQKDKRKITNTVITLLLDEIDSMHKSLRGIQEGIKKGAEQKQKQEKEKEKAFKEGLKKPLGEILIKMGAVSKESVDKALDMQSSRVGEILMTQGEVDEAQVEEALKIQGKEPEDLEQIQFSSYKIKRRDIRVDTQKLDMLFDLMGELITAQAMVIANPDLEGMELENFNKASSYLSKITREIQEITMGVRMVPLEGLFNKMRRLVRDLSRKFDKKINFQINGQETEMDRNVIEEISDPLIHIIRNAIDHGIENTALRKKQGKNETGEISLDAKYEGNEVWISVKDDGRGLDREKILKTAEKKGLLKDKNRELRDSEVWQFIFEPGFTTTDTISEISGRGVGMDVVNKNIELLRGKIDIFSTLGQGTEIIMKIPLTLAIIDGVNVIVGKSLYTIPINDITEFYKASANQVTKTDTQKEVLRLRDSIIPIIKLHEFFKTKTNNKKIEDGIVIVTMGEEKQKAGLLVDEIAGYQQVVIKALPRYMGKKRGISGCSVMGNGEVSLIIDINSILKEELEVVK